MLEVRDLTVRFEEQLAVADAAFSLPTGQVLAVLGPSGCGKSTLLRAVAGIEPVAAGSVAYDGADLTRVPTHRRGFALMFQDGQLFWHRDVAGNVAYPLRLRRRPRAEVRARVEELLELVGLGGMGARTPATLSGGERQRVALARSLAAQPRVLLLDEPLTALDRGMRDRLAGELGAILHRAGTTAVLVTHDQEEAFAVADRIAVMREGRLVQEGVVAEVWSAPVDVEVASFLGYATVLRGDAAARVLSAGRGEASGGGDRVGRGGPVGGIGQVDRVDEGAPSTGGGGSAVALRRSALRVASAGPLRGRVLAARVTPDLVRLVVDVEGLGEVHAVAGRAEGVAVGHDVRLTVDLGRAAVLGR